MLGLAVLSVGVISFYFGRLYTKLRMKDHYLNVHLDCINGALNYMSTEEKISFQVASQKYTEQLVRQGKL